MNKKAKLKLKKGDRVRVITGDETGTEGEILSVFRTRQRVVVKGTNIVTKHVKPSENNPEGGVRKMEAPIHISNVMLIDPKTGKPTKVGRKRAENGKLKRYSRKTNEFID